MKKCNYPLAPLVLAIVLGDKAEEAFRQSLLASQGGLGVFFSNGLVEHDHGARPDRAVLAADPERLDPDAPCDRRLEPGIGIDSTSQRCLIWNYVYQSANAPVPRRKRRDP